jgi:prepilin-type N-terminal cleavage/methylation domain-containing protein
MKGKKIDKDNKGMSLVEVIIAITIMGVVIVPVFQALTTAMVYNSKARVRQNLTITAESIMETFKGYSLDRLKEMFSSSGDTVAGVDGGSYSYVDTNYTVEEEDESGNISTVEKSGAYTFTIADFTQNNENYSAEISVVPNGTQEVYEVRDISTTTNAVFQGDRDYDKNLKNSMYNTYIANANSEVDGLDALFTSIYDEKVTEYESNEDYKFIGLKIYPGNAPSGTDISVDTLKVDDIKNYIKIHDRTTTFEINGNTATVNIEYHFTIENFPYVVVLEKIPKASSSVATEEGDLDLVPDLVFNGESGAKEESASIPRYPANTDEYLTYRVAIKGNTEIYNNTIPLDRLYVYYYPQYDKEDGSLIKDIIKIKNSAGINFSCYLIKQVAPDLSTANIKIGEGAYSPDIQLSGSGEVYLYHNLNINVATGEKKTGEYIIPSSFKGGGDYTASSDFVKAEQLSYKVVVQIKKGENVVSTLESTMNEKINDQVTTEATSES